MTLRANQRLVQRVAFLTVPRDKGKRLFDGAAAFTSDVDLPGVYAVDAKLTLCLRFAGEAVHRLDIRNADKRRPCR